VIRSDLPLSKCVDSDTDVYRLSDGVDVDRRLRGPRDRDVSSSAEKRFDLYDGAANADPVEQLAGPWRGDGGECAQDADRDDELGNRERVSHQCMSFRRANWFDSIW
jgi:hypothetical protein